MTEHKPGLGGEGLFDNLPKGVKDGLTAHTIRQMFDGTVFNGSNGVRVEFDQNGEVMGIDSVNLFTGQRAPSFQYGETGGFKGEGGFYGESTVMGKRLTSIVNEAKSDWQMWKETESEHPGVDFRTWKADRIKAMAQEHENLTGGAEHKAQYSATMQRHHDHYAQLEREGLLTEEDRLNFELAKRREQDGLVKPLE